MAAKKSNKTILLTVLGFAATGAALFFGGKFASKKIKEINQSNESKDFDSTNPKVKLAAQLAARAYSAMDGSGTDSDELNRIAVEIHRQGSGFYALVSDSYKKLTKGGNLYNDINEDSSPGEFARFLRCLNTGVFEADSWLDGIGQVSTVKKIDLF